MRIISLLLILIYVGDAFSQSQWKYQPFGREEKFFNHAPDAKIHWVTSSDEGDSIEYSVNADEECRKKLLLIFTPVLNGLRARSNAFYFKIPREDFEQVHFLVDLLNAYEPIEPPSMINEMKERFTSFHKRRGPEGIAVDGNGNFVLFGNNQQGISNRAFQVVTPSGHIAFLNVFDGGVLGFTNETLKMDIINKFLIAKNQCTICLEEKSRSAIIALHGQHEFCKDCLLEQLEWAWKDRADSSLLCCPYKGCDYELDESDVRKFSRNDENALRKFHKLTLNQLLRKNPNMRLCPGVDCDFVYEIPQGRLPEQVICPRDQCGQIFCSACQDSHNPVAINCTEFVRMKNMSNDQKEKATTEWLDKNTKPCPSCGDRVEKNGGCQYVKCKTCQELFCWICEQSFGKNLTGHQGSLPAHGWH